MAGQAYVVSRTLWLGLIIPPVCFWGLTMENGANDTCHLQGRDTVKFRWNFTRSVPFISYEVNFSVDGVEPPSWHQVCLYNYTKLGCATNSSRTCYCEESEGGVELFVLSLPSNRLFDNQDLRATNGLTKFRDRLGDLRKFPTVQIAPNETMWVNDVFVQRHDEIICEIEVEAMSKNLVKFCIEHYKPRIRFKFSVPGIGAWEEFGECGTFEVNVGGPTGIPLDTRTVINTTESTYCKRTKSQICTIRRITPDRLSIYPFHQLHSGSPCEEGVTVGDYFYFIGWMDVTGADADAREWVIYVQRDSKKEGFVNLLSLHIESDGCNNSYSGPAIYCFKKVNNRYHIIVNLTADPQLNKRRIRLWREDGETSRSQLLPTIHQKVTASLVFKGHTIDLSLPPSEWKLPLVRDEENIFKFCVSRHINRPFFLEMHVLPSLSRGIHNQLCLEVSFQDACNKRDIDFEFEYFQMTGCFKRQKFRFEEHSTLKIDGKLIQMDWDSPNCPFGLSDITNTLEFCVWNLAKPFWLIGLINGTFLSKVYDKCLKITNLTQTGQLIFRSREIKCGKDRDYPCLIPGKGSSRRVSTTATTLLSAVLNLIISTTHSQIFNTSDLRKPCSFSVEEGVLYSIQMCVLNGAAPYYIRVSVTETELLKFITLSCVNFPHIPDAKTAKSTYTFKVTDNNNVTEAFYCSVDLVRTSKSTAIASVTQSILWVLSLILIILALLVVAGLVAAFMRSQPSIDEEGEDKGKAGGEEDEMLPETKLDRLLAGNESAYSMGSAVDN